MSSTYTGTPSNSPASITIPSDGDVIDAASVNVAFEALADRTAFLADWNANLKNASMDNWPYAAQIFGANDLVAFSVGWHPFLQEWVAACKSDDTTVQLYASPDGGSWHQIAVDAGASSARAPGAMAFSPTSDKIILASAPVSNGGTMGLWTYTGGTLTSLNLGAGQGQIQACAGAYFKGQFLLFGKGMVPSTVWPANDNCVLSTATGDAAGDYTTASFYSTTPIAKWICGQNASRLVLVGENGDASPLVYSDNGTSWTTATSALSFVGSLEVPTSLVWSDALSKWVLLVTSVSTNSRIYTSTDGLSWSLYSTLPAGIVLISLNLIGSAWCAVGMAAGVDFHPRVFSSVDGITWTRRMGWISYLSADDVMGVGVTGISRKGVVLSSGKSFLLASNIDQRGSLIGIPFMVGA